MAQGEHWIRAQEKGDKKRVGSHPESRAVEKSGHERPIVRTLSNTTPVDTPCIVSNIQNTARESELNGEGCSHLNSGLQR